MARNKNETDFQYNKKTINDSGGRPYDVYAAVLTQSGSNAPVATVLENTFDGALTWSRVSAGTYNVVRSGSFVSGKTFCTATLNGVPSTGEKAAAFGYVAAHKCTLKVHGTGSALDNWANPMSVEIRVYN